ncbi:MAG: HAD-IIIA family hydrolase [Paracoccaceae bacterium]|nr:HAD-IIIA family hydrolase [Loktanella sp.]
MRTVIFDLDGTLADTSGDLLSAANACFRDLGLGDLLTLDRDAGVALKGGRAMLRRGFERSGGHGEDEVDRQYARLLDYYDQAIDTHTILYPGAMEAVQHLKSQGYAVAICTNKPEALASKLLTRMGILDEFAAMLGADTLTVRKPDPEHLRETARRAGGSPDRMVLIGDTETDHSTARNAGCPSILVSFGPGGGDDVVALAPDALIGHFDELPAAVTRLIG